MIFLDENLIERGAKKYGEKIVILKTLGQGFYP